MAMGRRAKQRRQELLWIAHTELPRTVAHPFYEQLNRLLEERGFDDFVERESARFYAERMGRPSLVPGRYFRLLLIGYFEGIDGERGIPWRAADSLALRSFLGIGLEEKPPDHSTISRTRRLIAVETHQAVFRWVLELLAEKGLLKGKTVGIDATTLEANAAMRSIVRRDTGEGYEEFLRRLAEESGISTPTREQLAKLDRKRAKKGSNEDWVNPHDPEAGITKLKDGRTHLAYKAEHAVDLETGAVVAVTVATRDAGDTATILETLPQAGEHIAEVAWATNHEGVGERVQPEGPGRRSRIRDITATTRCRCWRKRKFALTSRNRIVEGVVGKTSRKRSTRCTATGGEFAGNGGNSCCGGEESCWNAASPTPMRPEGCGACTCEDGRMFSSGSWLTWAHSICGW
jgi:transposase